MVLFLRVKLALWALHCVIGCDTVMISVVLCCVVLCCVVLCCVVLCCVVLCCVVLCCVVVWCGVVCCVVPIALLPEGNGRDVYPRVQVNGRAVCRSARCVPVCCCTTGTSAQLQWAGAALPTPVHDHTGYIGLSTFCNSCNAPPHCLWAVGSGTLAMHRHTACGQWAVELLLCTATVPGGNGQWNSYNALPHCLWVVGSGTPAMHRHTACGQWAVELLLCPAPACFLTFVQNT